MLLVRNQFPHKVKTERHQVVIVCEVRCNRFPHKVKTELPSPPYKTCTPGPLGRCRLSTRRRTRILVVQTLPAQPVSHQKCQRLRLDPVASPAPSPTPCLTPSPGSPKSYKKDSLADDEEGDAYLRFVLQCPHLSHSTGLSTWEQDLQSQYSSVSKAMPRRLMMVRVCVCVCYR